jgi:hypothetical protein
MTGNNAGSLSGKIAALLGIFFGIGFLVGFFTGYGYRPAVTAGSPAVAESPAGLAPNGPVTATASPDISAWAPETPDGWEDQDGQGGIEDEESETLPPDSGLTLEAHELGEDENGLFISGTILNGSSHGYDAVRVTFDLCDASGKVYSGVTDVTYDSMAPGDSWGFAIYIPYAEMGLFSSYRLQSIIGASR